MFNKQQVHNSAAHTQQSSTESHWGHVSFLSHSSWFQSDIRIKRSRTKLDLKVPLIPSLDLIPESSSAPARFWFQEVLLQIDADSCSALIPRDNKKLTSTMCTEDVVWGSIRAPQSPGSMFHYM
ncbi:hypothetical protein EYF80_047379 [Liparis tanakae]|uniref:Uncharacterized protein n=1 Tax=Liparis tanakae TaxID=230148 RepID=A0A4Z2FNG5_9TELE|nr:hypothetical protein EYF80_047379 [Liparis tanakae]